MVTLARRRHVATDLGSIAAGGRPHRPGGMGNPVHRQHDCACPSTCCWGKKSSAEAEGLGRSRGGLTTKVHARVDGKGRPFTFSLSPGQQHDATLAEQLMQQGAVRSGKQVVRAADPSVSSLTKPTVHEPSSVSCVGVAFNP